MKDLEKSKTSVVSSANDLLVYFTGTEKYYNHFMGYYYTDGIKYMAETFEAYWLIDVIFSHQLNPLVKSQPFQTWTLKKIKGNKFCASCTDGNNILIVNQFIPFSDFPHDIITLFFVDNVLLVPTEY